MKTKLFRKGGYWHALNSRIKNGVLHEDEQCPSLRSKQIDFCSLVMAIAWEKEDGARLCKRCGRMK